MKIDMKRNTFKSGALATCLLLSSSLSAAAVIDFEKDAAGNALGSGDVIAEQWADWGVHFSTTTTINNDGQTPAQLMIFDSLNPTGGDNDLTTKDGDRYGTGNDTELGNVLIISEDNDANDPDDKGNGGNVFVTFDAPVTINSLGILDIEQSGNTIEFFNGLGALLDTLNLTDLNDNSFQEHSDGWAGVASMKYSFRTSAAITHLDFSAQSVSEPAAVMLLGVGLVGLIRRRTRGKS